MRAIQLLLLTTLFISTTCLASTTQATDDPVEIIQSIREEFRKGYEEAHQQGKVPDQTALEQAMKSSARAAISGLCPHEIDAGLALDWAELFYLASDKEGTITLVNRFLSTSPGEKTAARAYTLYFRCASDTVAPSVAVKKFESMHFEDDILQAQLVAVGGYYAQGIAKDHPQLAIKLIDTLDHLLDGPMHSDESDVVRAVNSAITSVVGAKAKVLEHEKGHEDAVQFLKSQLDRYSERTELHKALQAQYARCALIGSPAPGLEMDRSIGEFEGMDAARGNVLLLYFTAHWCGPCKSDYPSVVEIYEEMKDSGLQIAFVTKYFGWYAQTKATPDQEFEKMKGFMEQFELPGAMVFGSESNFETYGVTGIPALVIIDKKGVVRKIVSGAGQLKANIFEIKHLLEE